LEKFASEAGIPINVTVFERNSYIGGRTTTVDAYGHPLMPVELGASIFVEINTILKNASELFDLRPTDYNSDSAEVLGIWNGKSFVYQQKDSGWYYWDIAKLLWKYGLAPMRTQKLMKDTVGKFKQLYVAPFFPFRSLSDRALDLGLTPVTSLTGEQLLAENNVNLRDLFYSCLRILTVLRLVVCLQPTLFKLVLGSTMGRISMSSMDLKQWSVWLSMVPCKLRGVIGKSLIEW